MAEREKENECVSFRDFHSEFIGFVLWLWTLYSSVYRSCNNTETNTLDNTIDSDHSSIALYAQLYMSCSTNQTFHRTPNMYNAIQAFQHFTAFFFLRVCVCCCCCVLCVLCIQWKEQEWDWMNDLNSNCVICSVFRIEFDVFLCTTFTFTRPT